MNYHSERCDVFQVVMNDNGELFGVIYQDGREVFYGWTKDPEKALKKPLKESRNLKPEDFIYSGYPQIEEVQAAKVVEIKAKVVKSWGLI